MKDKKLYYEENEREFYWVKETPKTIIIDWVAKYNCDNNKTLLDQNVCWKNLKLSKDNSRSEHCFKGIDEDGGILIYPMRAGQPFYLLPATETHITSEIKNCIRWGVSSKYYQNLIQIINLH